MSPEEEVFDTKPEEPVRNAAPAAPEETPAEPETPEIYADAHYEPAGETTTPPRYYTPPQRSVRVRAVRKREKRKVNLGAAVALCLICALLGGLLGAAVNYSLTEDRFRAMEQAIAENARADAETARSVSDLEQRQAGGVSPVSSASGAMTPDQIYELACRQTVGITTTVTTPSYFGQPQTGEISGSGFILSEDGYIMTNYHVVEYAAAGDLPVTVVLRDGTEYEARIVGTEDVNDIAVLKIEASGLTPVELGNSDELRVGEEIYPVGNPLGELEFSMSTGHVSALDRVISTDESEAISMFQIDAAVNAGNSGGPVYNDQGQVIGVVTAKYKQTGVEGLGFAIPINDAARIAQELIENGYVTGKAYMGVWLDDRYNSMAAQFFNMPMGAYISTVEPGSAADKAGLREGDVITRLGDQEVTGPADLRRAIRQYGAGDEAEIVVFRDGDSLTFTIVFDERTPDSGAVNDEG